MTGPFGKRGIIATNDADSGASRFDSVPSGEFPAPVAIRPENRHPDGMASIGALVGLRPPRRFRHGGEHLCFHFLGAAHVGEI